MDQKILRGIPKVDLLLARAAESPEMKDRPHRLVVEGVRKTLEELRSRLLAGDLGEVPPLETLMGQVIQQVEADLIPSLRPVINATGVVLHTNLGRAVLSPAAAAQALAVASGYSTLEYDPATGGRGSRQVHLEKILTGLTGAEAALAVNNNAAAVLLIMAALFKDRELIVSRGELVEIGGAFRIPDIMELGGVRLRAVGATNRTRLDDYARAIDPDKTGGLLKVHPSNFRVIGYTGQPGLAELAALAHERGLPLVHDLGSGVLADLAPLGIHDEPTVSQALKDGADLVAFSGDKLLGGAQAGLVVGRPDLIERMKAHPLARALRVDKMTLAALEATLRLYLDPDQARRSIPTQAMIFLSPQELRVRADRLRQIIAETAPSLETEVTAAESRVGGGAAPERPLPSWAVTVKSARRSESVLEERLRRGQPPVVVRLVQDRLLLDLRTIDPGQFPALAEALKRAEED